MNQYQPSFRPKCFSINNLFALNALHALTTDLTALRHALLSTGILRLCSRPIFGRLCVIQLQPLSTDGARRVQQVSRSRPQCPLFNLSARQHPFASTCCSLPRCQNNKDACKVKLPPPPPHTHTHTDTHHPSPIIFSKLDIVSFCLLALVICMHQESRSHNALHAGSKIIPLLSSLNIDWSLSLSPLSLILP